MTDTEFVTYSTIRAPLEKRLIFKTPNNRIAWNADKLRQLCLITSWLDFCCCHDGIKADDLAQPLIQSQQGTLRFQLLKQVGKAMSTTL
jgi:hypothetical protein